MSRPRVSLENHRLDLEWPSAGIQESRVVKEAEYKLFANWSSNYRLAREQAPVKLLALGRAL